MFLPVPRFAGPGRAGLDMHNLLTYCAIAFILGISHPSFAASKLTISAAGNGVFILQGAGMEGTAALDITLNYDASTLANPKVEQGSLIYGAMMAANPNIPGIVRVAVIRTTPITGNGPILTFAFDRKGGSPGKITGLNIRLSDISGKPLQASVQVMNPAETAAASDDASTQQKISAKDTSPPAEQPIIPSTSIIAGPVEKPEDTPLPKQEEPAAVPLEQGEPAKEPAVAKAEQPMQTGGAEQPEKSAKGKTIYTQKSILELFRDFKEAKSPKALLALFDREPMIGFRQEPAVAMSDGKSAVRVTFISMTKAGSKPEVSLKGASLTALKKDDNNTNTWIAEAKPEKGIAAASLVVPQQNLTMEFPLLVAPKADPDMDRSGKVTDEDFALFLKGPKGKKLKGFDLNADGAVNYIDEYIFAANYLTALSNTKDKKAQGK